MKFSALIAVVLFVWATLFKSTSGQALNFLRDLIQQNVAGDPIIHKQVEWKFDPEVSKKRRNMFYKLHGYRADKLIERLGLGIDGQEDERLAYQQARDAGHLGGLNYYRD